MKKKRCNTFTVLIKIVAVLLVPALLAGLFAPYISPNHFWPAAFFGLAFPGVWMLSLLSALLLIRHKRWFLVLIMLTIAGLPLMLRHFSVPTTGMKQGAGQYMIMSYNVHGFAGIREGKSSYERQTLVHDFINDLKPAVVCLQEYPMKSRKHARYLDRLNQELDLEYKHISDFDAASKGTSYTFLTATRFPVIQRGTVFTMDTEICGIFTDIKMPEGIVRVYNIHLQSVKLSGEKKLLRPHRNPGSAKYIFSYVKGSFRKLRKAFPARVYQTRMIRRSIETSPYPVIICGDFNDTPASYTYQLLQQGKQDAAIGKGWGFNRTYAESIYPIRIDHILIDCKLETQSYQRKKIYISDHFPVIAGFGFKRP